MCVFGWEKGWGRGGKYKACVKGLDGEEEMQAVKGEKKVFHGLKIEVEAGVGGRLMCSLIKGRIWKGYTQPLEKSKSWIKGETAKFLLDIHCISSKIPTFGVVHTNPYFSQTKIACTNGV